MKKLFLLFLVTLCLFIFSTEIFGNTFSIGGDLTTIDRENLILELDYNQYLAFYANYYKYNSAGSNYTTTILGVDYFFNHKANYTGLYVGTGVPRFKKLSYDSSCGYFAKKAYDLDYELKADYRLKPPKVIAYLPWCDFGYSNIREFYCDIGYTF